MLGAGLPEGTAVSFAAPEGSWAPETPTLNAFLSQVHEDLQARVAHWTDLRDDRNRVVGRQPPLRRYRACYVLTAWTAGAEAEHALLGAALGALARYDCVPAEYLSGSLAEAGQPVRLDIASPNEPEPAMDLWSALGIRPRTHLSLVLIVPLVPAVLGDLGTAPATIDLGIAGSPPVSPSQQPANGRPAKRIRET